MRPGLAILPHSFALSPLQGALRSRVAWPNFLRRPNAAPFCCSFSLSIGAGAAVCLAVAPARNRGFPMPVVRPILLAAASLAVLVAPARAADNYDFLAAPQIDLNRIFRVDKSTGEVGACQFGLKEGSQVGVTLCYPAGPGGWPTAAERLHAGRLAPRARGGRVARRPAHRARCRSAMCWTIPSSARRRRNRQSAHFPRRARRGSARTPAPGYLEELEASCMALPTDSPSETKLAGKRAAAAGALELVQPGMRRWARDGLDRARIHRAARRTRGGRPRRRLRAHLRADGGAGRRPRHPRHHARRVCPSSI